MDASWIDKLYGALVAVGKWIQETIGKDRMREQLYGEISNNYYITHVRLDRVTSIQGLDFLGLGETSEELVRAAYGANYVRLVEIKKKYDPKKVLRLNQNIK
jgi:hypothetical protein